MTPLQRHILLPSLVPLLFCAVAATPVEWLGCRNRGLLALLIALVSMIAGLVAAVTAINRQRQGDPQARWWLKSAALLAIAPIFLIILA